MFQDMNPGDLVQQLAKWPVHGIELTLRNGGWIDPSQTQEKLPPLMDLLHQVDRSTVILATDIQQADHRDVQRVLEPASKLGIRYVRLGYHHYDFNQPLLPQLDAIAKHFQGLASVLGSLNMQGLYQNHAGAKYVGAPFWDLFQVLSEIDPNHLGVAFDIRHASIEAHDGWKIAAHLLRDHIRSIYVKDASILNGAVHDVPLGKGAAKPVFDQLRQLHVPGPIALQVEYLEPPAKHPLADRLHAMENDIHALIDWMS